MEFDNKIVIITGASVGIGKATAIEFARNGANVCIVDINAEGLDALAEEIKSIGANVTSYICDVSDEQHQFETVQKNDGNFSVKAGHHKALERDCLKRPRFYRGLLKFCGKNKKSCEG